MIKSNELRIGNLVIGNAGEPFMICNGSMIDGKYNPIPITPEILEKCGFVKDRNDTNYIFEYVEIVVSHTGKFFYFRDYFLSVELTSLHQLQNLYFALTGNELNIEL